LKLRFVVGTEGPRGERATGSTPIEPIAIEAAAGYHVAKEDENAAIGQRAGRVPATPQ